MAGRRKGGDEGEKNMRWRRKREWWKDEDVDRTKRYIKRKKRRYIEREVGGNKERR